MKLAILGTGMIVKDFMTAIDALNLEKVDILATENTIPEAMEMIAEHHLDNYYLDYDEMLASADIDTVYVALPNFLHYSFAKKALQAGKNVIVEKPATSNLKELEELNELAKSKDKILVEAMNIHYMPLTASMKENLTRLGKLKIVSINYSQYSSRYDAFKKGDILPAFDPAKSGGALMDLNVYNIHTLVHLFGKPRQVNYLANVERGIDTSGILTLDYGTFKAVAIGAKDCKAPITSTLQGDEGYIRFTGPASMARAYELADNRGSSQTIQFDAEKHRMIYEFEAFQTMIERHDTALCQKMMAYSLTAMDIITTARQQAGVIFPADK